MSGGVNAHSLVSAVRRELEDVNKRVENHPYLIDAEKGALPRHRLKLFVENQYYIVYHDLRSLSIMVSRASTHQEAEYLSRLQGGDIEAFRELLKLGEELDAGFRQFHEMSILPQAVSYTHYLAWLSIYGATVEHVAALIVNLPVWGRACSRLASALRNRYGIKSLGFLEAFSNIPSWVEEEGKMIIENYLPAAENRVRNVAKMIQAYELGFWDSIYSG